MRTKLISFTALLLLSLAGLITAHEEPPKSSADLADQDRIRLRFCAAKVKSETWQKTVYSEAGKVVGQFLYARNQYDRDGRQVRAVVYDSSNKTLGNLEHIYDLEHQMVEQMDCSEDSACERTIFVYRSDHLMALAIDLAVDGSPIARLEYSYPAGDTVVHLIKKDTSGAVKYTLDYFFKPNRIVGYVVRGVKKGPDGKTILRIEQTGDSRGLLDKTVMGPNDKTTAVYKYTRREDGQLQKLVHYGSDGRVQQISSWQFGPNDLPIRQTTADSLLRVQYVMEYHYDNW